MRLHGFRWSGFGVVVIGLSVVLGGCVSIPPDERPEITLANLSIQEATVFETAVEATIRFTNPALDPVQIDGATFKLVLDGRKVGRGMMQEQFAIDGLGTRTAKATFYVNNAAALLKLRSILDRNAVDYGMMGNLYVTRGPGTVKVRVERSGHLDLREVGIERKGVEAQ